MAFLGIGKKLGLGSTAQVLSGLGNIGAGLAGVGAIGTGITQAFGGGTQQGQSVAVSQATQTVPQETQSSSANVGVQPYLGAGVATAPLVSAGRAIGQGFGQLVGRLPTGTIPTAIGVAGGAAIGMMDGAAPAQMRFTRKQQAQVKEMVELVGFEAAMSILGVDAATLAFMLTKKFPRRGQGITAAQLRTATRVNNRIIHMHDKLKAAYGASTRRTTTRRAASTRITQVKN
jgi:hypothetical protein